MNKLFVDQKGAAEIIGFSIHTLQKWRMVGGGPPYQKIGRSVRYPIQALKAWGKSMPVYTVPRRKRIRPEILMTLDI